MRVKTPEYRSSVAVVELVDGKVKIRLPQTANGNAIAIRLAEILGAMKGVAILHRTKPKGEGEAVLAALPDLEG